MKTNEDRFVELMAQNRDRLIELIKQGNGSPEEIADRLITNEIIVPPCKVGQTVWVNHEHYKEGMHTYAVQVHKYTYKSTPVTRLWLVGEIINPCYGPQWYYELFSWDDVGTKVFLTKEDAEKALKECKGG